MGNYDYWKCMVADFDVIATDQAIIDPSWEGFFSKENWGKKIYQWVNNGDGDWHEVMPGFSK